MQGLFARVGSGDPVRVLRLFHNNYTGYCCIHLLCRATYNLSLPRLSANYYGLPTTVQLWAAHESRCSLVGVSRSTAVRYCTVPALKGIVTGPFNQIRMSPFNLCVETTCCWAISTAFSCTCGGSENQFPCSL